MSFTLSEARRRAPVLAMALAVLLGLLIGYSAPAAHAERPSAETVATWNSQGAKWSDVRNLSRDNGIVLVQEAGPRPDPLIMRHVISILTPNGYAVERYEWPDRGGAFRHVYWLAGRPQDGGNGGRVNLAIVTHRPADEVFVAPPGRNGTRPALGVRFDDDIYYSVHAQASGRHNEANELTANIDQQARQAGRHWAAVGDFNRDPSDMGEAGRAHPGYIYQSGRATQQSGGELDYMISSRLMPDYYAQRGAYMNSDHYPVIFRTRQVRLGVPMGLASASDQDRVLAPERGSSENGTRIVPVTDSMMGIVTWRLRGAANNHLNLVNNQTDKCIDVSGGNGATSGSSLNEWDCAGQHSQEFSLTSIDPGSFHLVHERTKLCVTMKGEKGLRFPVLSRCTDTDTQLFIPVFRS
ncbi:RICIN domain-containing protein [Streptomyces sp. NPDC017056]|uniref:RICIN domain-containing protein n=1 Tax=Streptomyces sp. NPDC017056 TaxID=3364973 RepID=UPI0037B878CD